jgi:hypothetical protein
VCVATVLITEDWAVRVAVSTTPPLNCLESELANRVPQSERQDPAIERQPPALFQGVRAYIEGRRKDGLPTPA